MTMKPTIVLSEDKFRGRLALYLKTTRNGAMDLIGTYKRNITGDWGAEIGTGQVFEAKSRAALRSKIASAINQQ